ncbi:MAG TPA: hypothetical protein VL754_06260 [Verrucomicrobiae bacterium]|jgi:hypothetical protein|nr:hypothetical protein [Verrucomicrobiae bacterium]
MNTRPTSANHILYAAKNQQVNDRFVAIWRSDLAGEFRLALVGGALAWVIASTIFLIAIKVL